MNRIGQTAAQTLGTQIARATRANTSNGVASFVSPIQDSARTVITPAEYGQYLKRLGKKIFTQRWQPLARKLHQEAVAILERAGVRGLYQVKAYVAEVAPRKLQAMVCFLPKK